VSDTLHPDRFSFLHIDLNSFFASVEQQLHPEYRGRPLAVVPTMADTTCCIAASYEAKTLGIKTGTKVGKAKEICPDIILVAGDHAEYAKYSHRIAEAVELACPVSHTPSIDEMVCQLMGREQEPSRSNSPSTKTLAPPCAAPSVWRLIATSRRLPAICKNPTVSSDSFRHNSPAPSPILNSVTFPVSAHEPKPA